MNVKLFVLIATNEEHLNVPVIGIKQILKVKLMKQSWPEFTGLFSDILSAPTEPAQKFADSLLNKDFLKIKSKLRSEGKWHHWSFGLCYVVSECAYYMLGGKEEGWKPMFVRHMGCPHWFLQHEDGTVYDPTGAQFTAPVHYEAARGKGFMTKKPCKRTLKLMQRINRNVKFINEQCPDLDKVIEERIVALQEAAPRILARLDLLDDDRSIDADVQDWNTDFKKFQRDSRANL